ncbi:hypothetical protein H6F39_13395 [Anabaena sp. FACHB-1250]|uniref:Glucose-inhibited division protein A n=2 Tax=Dolichospermum TaxID=748770 RepID=A0A480AGD1_9CYAN|nr:MULTISPECIES: hypothetical protein [Nostocales]MBD2142323.1 hypothetical protein [Anabaena sp. FACHB-1250]MBD2269825.1 hypothetical protein [Anabaena sp. FACHB-1391]MBE9217896.1 hypothetical protein [Dolichospermum flos-aquae LEGE 04289]GCL43402.1 hypothetical protein NIES80_31160 [Dolichospermum planctonicum]
MNRSQIVAIITGVISILLAIAYLIVVQIIDYRDMKPAPTSQLSPQVVITVSNLPGSLCKLLVKV